MGRSNGCEANRKREDAAKRAAKFSKDGNSQKDANLKAMTVICAICTQAFMQTQKKMAEVHWENKHKGGKNGKTFEECFPMCVEVDEEKNVVDDYAQYEKDHGAEAWSKKNMLQERKGIVVGAVV